MFRPLFCVCFLPFSRFGLIRSTPLPFCLSCLFCFRKPLSFSFVIRVPAALSTIVLHLESTRYCFLVLCFVLFV
uniref:Putative secreted protein n=1 Tax=Anopheles marajoara TaxID=58244 RepID=A0A2M4CDE6_9DIPT